MSQQPEATCQICKRTLHHDEHTTCQNCTNRFRNTLTSILEQHRELPDAIATITGISYTRSGSRAADDITVPGGPALVMLANGTTGNVTSSRTGNRDHATDQNPNDPPSTAAVLAGIEDDWRQARHDPPANNWLSLNASAAYLHKHTTWAARVHPAFPDHLHELQQLLTRMEIVTGDHTMPERTDVTCLDCGGPLTRRYTDAGIDDTVRCETCNRDYTDFTYRLAALAKAEKSITSRPDANVTEPQARALYSNLAPGTIRTWISRGHITPTGRNHRGEATYRIGDIAARVEGSVA